MKRSMLLAVLALTAVALVLSATAANAANERPLKATVEMCRYGYEGPYQLYVGAGTVPHCGYTLHYAAVDLSVITGTVTVYSNDVDSFVIEFDQEWDDARQLCLGTYTIIGGTGKFADAGGSGRIMTKAIADYPWVVVDYEGTISY
jgi:hypothetical protein